MAFVDGNDLCEGCSRCCSSINGLLVSNEELERLPAFAAHVSETDGDLSRIVIDGPCPYLDDDGWCSTFDTRPFDCSLFPAQVGGIRRDPGQPGITVTWRFGGDECPQRTTFASAGVTEGQLDAFRSWIGDAVHATPVTLNQDRTGERASGHARRAVVTALTRVGLLDVARRLRNRSRDRR